MNADKVGIAIDDDDIAYRLGINRHYVNAICRTLSDEGVIIRTDGPAGKLVNEIALDREGKLLESPAILWRGTTKSDSRTGRDERARRNVEALVANFSDYVGIFERSAVFPGPSLYFHKRALERRRAHADAASLLADMQFLEYVYAVLPAWGMHRMGNQKAKVVEFEVMTDSFRSAEAQIQALWNERITAIDASDATGLTDRVWELIASLKVSSSNTRIVAGSKALHHVLPDLVPPIDRQYTFRFFTGQKNVQHGEARAFSEWFPLLCEIGRRCRHEIEGATARGGFMATGPAKVIDNAIIGFMQTVSGIRLDHAPTGNDEKV